LTNRLLRDISTYWGPPGKTEFDMRNGFWQIRPSSNPTLHRYFLRAERDELDWRENHQRPAGFHFTRRGICTFALVVFLVAGTIIGLSMMFPNLANQGLHSLMPWL
jgi:hypothetical protein